MLPSPPWFLARTLEAALWCCCAGDGESFLCATEATDETVPVNDQNKSNYAIKGFFLPRAASSTLLGLWGVSFSQHMCPHSLFPTTMELLRQDGYWSQSNESHSLTRGHRPLSQNCFTIFSKANGDKEPIYVSAGLQAATARLCLLLFFHGLFVPAAFGDRAQTFPLPPHVSLPLVHTLPAVKPYPAEYHVFDINYMSEPHESH